MTAREISERLTNQAEAIACYLLPSGKRIGREWTVGSKNGEPGESLKVCVAGTKAGIWADFATGDRGDMLDLWQAVRGLSLSEAIHEAKGYLGISETQMPQREKKIYKRPSRPSATKPKTETMRYLTEDRKLSEKTIADWQVGEIDKVGAEPGPWIVFPFKRGDELIFLKYLHMARAEGKKKIRASADSEPCLFGWNMLPKSQRWVILCEGEIDAMSFYEYGVPALSVPFGGGGGEKQKWIECEYERMEVFDDIILAMDNDEAGQQGALEIAQRLGLHRCRVVKLPYKDANECLKNGVTKDELLQCFEQAENLDPEELKRAGHYTEAVIERFYPTEGKKPGFDLPWLKTSGKIRILMGELSIWSGYNGSGKSLMLGQIMDAACRQSHKACIASFEMSPDKTLARMTRQELGEKPTAQDIQSHMAWLNEKVWIFDLVGTAKVKRMIEVFDYAHKRYGIKQFVVDSLSKCGLADDDYNGQKSIVDVLGDFAKRTGSHVHLVVHARKGGDELTPPGKMDIKGTGGITDMADNVFIVYRNKAKEKLYQAVTNGKRPKGENRSVEEIAGEYDAFLICDKCREDGESEGMYGLMFDRVAQQYKEK
jgi:twinkle protein